MPDQTPIRIGPYQKGDILDFDDPRIATAAVDTQIQIDAESLVVANAAYAQGFTAGQKAKEDEVNEMAAAVFASRDFVFYDVWDGFGERFRETDKWAIGLNYYTCDEPQYNTFTEALAATTQSEKE